MLYVRYVNLDSESPRWIQSVNIVTIGWVVFFLVGLLAFDSDLFGFKDPLLQLPDTLAYYWDILSWIIWSVFAFDVFLKYRVSENWKIFLKKHWFDIVLLVPFFRLFRVFRLLRLLKTMKFAKAGLGMFKVYRKSKRFKK